MGGRRVTGKGKSYSLYSEQIAFIIFQVGATVSQF